MVIEAMDEENQHFSVGIWLVKSGKEKDFIATFGAFAEWVFDRNLGAEEVYLLQDIEQPSRFITFRSLGKHPEDRRMAQASRF